MTGYLDLYNPPERRSGLYPNAFPVPGPLSPPSDGGSPQLPVASAWAKLTARDHLKMSSPHTLQSPAGHPLELNTSDPYLSAPSDPEESEFQASAIRLTPVGGSPGHSVSSPHDGTASVSGHSTQAQDFLSPRGNPYIDPSACTSPNNGGFLAPSDIDLASGIGTWSNGTAAPFGAAATAVSTHPTWTPTLGMGSSQYLNPENTIPSPASATENFQAQTNLPMTPGSFVRPLQPGLGISSQNYGQPRLSVSSEHIPRQNDTAPITRGRSPTVTVEYIPRGDSPKEEPSVFGRRASRSSVHLSVSGLGDQSSESEDDEGQRSNSSNLVPRGDNGHWLPNPAGHRGLDPPSRGNDYVPSPNDLKGEREREQKIEDIRGWSAGVSEAGSEPGDDPAIPRRRQVANSRLRARSTGDRPLQQEDYFSLKFGAADQSIPGPRLMLHESSDDEYSETSESTADADEPGRYDRSTPEIYSSLEQVSPHEGDFRLYPWNDYPRGPIQTEAMQPGSSTAAMVAYEKRAKDLETASLTATIDNNSIRNFGMTFERMSISDAPKKRSNSLFKRAHQQASNILKRQASDLSLATVNSHQAPPEQTQRKDSGSHRHRLSLSTKQNKHSRSPSLSNALLSMSGQLAAVGGSHSVQAVSPNAEPSPSRSSFQGRNSLQTKARGRSRSEVPRAPTPGLMDLMTTHGGPPVASITRYQQQDPSAEPTPTPTSAAPEPDMAGIEDEDDIELADEKGVVMQFPPVTRLPVPTFEGFKAQIMQINPRLEPALIHRFAHAQVQRYKTLVELQQKHSTAVANRNCKSGTFCGALGGQPVLLQQHKTLADAEAGQTQFRITEFSQGGDQPYITGEGAIAAAQFPPGVPLPPVSRLPAQFECPICFQVKQFQKPSDWTKHVHEDVQPFTCSFPECMEPKSFKRKADWVRHESERHRQLEWWTCSYHPDCTHTCYRKNNFVQHLVREHKMTDPRAKKTKGSTTAEGSAASQRDQEFWQMVADCRHEPEQPPSQEPCRFCGNVCSSWKKLTVHLGKHMEQLAMPVLELAKQSSTPSSIPVASGSASHASDLAAAPAPAPLPAAPFQGHPEDPGASAQLARQQYPTNEVGPPASHSQAFYYPDVPMSNYQSITGSQISMEPDSIDLPADQFPDYGMGQFDQATLHPPTQTHPLHQNSSTYPPPRTPETNPSLVPNSYSLSSQLPSQSAPAPTQPQHQHQHQHQAQSSLYPTQAGYPAYQSVAPNGSYNSAYTSSYSPQM